MHTLALSLGIESELGMAWNEVSNLANQYELYI